MPLRPPALPRPPSPRSHRGPSDPALRSRSLPQAAGEAAIIRAEMNESSNQLPVFGAAPRERADAARNRERVGAVAAKLFAERGAANVSMDEIAAAAGVGKGTLFRRFGDKAGLARYVLSESERAFQDDLLRGRPPLGPGAPARERIVAFGVGLLEMTELHSDLLLAADSGGHRKRYHHPVYVFHRTHVRNLVREADSGVDADYLADVLLAALGAELLTHQGLDRQMDREQLSAGFRELVERLLPR